VTSYNDEPTLRTHPASAHPAAAACLQASLLLRRRIHRLHDVGVTDQQALLAMCQLLDALSRGLADAPTVPGAIERAALRLADQLHRADSHRAPPHPAEPARS
jgi:hypothetical protein